jgi:TolB-like protein/Flp pilus assembly protein TadD
MSLFAELKRRKVIRVAVVYAATAFVVLQAADIMLPHLAVPDWAMTLVVVFAVLGFPIALVLGWALEVTPDGIKVTRPREVAPTDDPPPALLGKRTVFAAALLVVLGVGIGAGWFLRPMSGPDVTPQADPDAELAADSPAVVEQSIAVLPFVNMSADPEQEYFSDGLSEEILNLLAQIRDLRVIGRTSSFAFKGRNEDLRSIGSTLGVAYLLEGSVRKAGDDLRITAQLIRADDGSHLWSQSYDRRLENVFAIQTEIAGSIAEALRISLVGPDQAAPVAQAAASLPAYDLFLQARRLIQGRTRSGIEAARKLLDDALALDPDYAPALAAAAQAVLLLNDEGVRGYGDIPLDQAVVIAQPLLDRALGLDPDLAEAHAVQGMLYSMQRDSPRAEAALARALALNPGQSDALNSQAGLLGNAGRLREALATRRRLAELDPLHVANLQGMSWALLESGKLAEAQAAAVRLQRAFPDNPQGFADEAGILITSGRQAEARAPAARALALAPGDAIAQRVDAWLYYTLGDFDRVLSLPDIRFHGGALIATGRVDEAVAEARERLAAAPDDHNATTDLLFTLSQAGRHDEVLALYRARWGDLDGIDARFGTGAYQVQAPIAAAQHALGQHEALAETLAHWRERLAFLRGQGYAGRNFPITEARYLALAGERAAALAALTKAIDLGWRGQLLDRDPAFAGLHDDADFLAQGARMRDRINIERAKLGMEPLS